MKKNNTIFYQGNKYLIIASTRYFGTDYIFVINSQNTKDVKVLVCSNELEELDDIALIYKMINRMRIM